MTPNASSHPMRQIPYEEFIVIEDIHVADNDRILRRAQWRPPGYSEIFVVLKLFSQDDVETFKAERDIFYQLLSVPHPHIARCYGQVLINRYQSTTGLPYRALVLQDHNIETNCRILNLVVARMHRLAIDGSRTCVGVSQAIDEAIRAISHRSSGLNSNFSVQTADSQDSRRALPDVNSSTYINRRLQAAAAEQVAPHYSMDYTYNSQSSGVVPSSTINTVSSYRVWKVPHYWYKAALGHIPCDGDEDEVFLCQDDYVRMLEPDIEGRPDYCRVFNLMNRCQGVVPHISLEDLGLQRSKHDDITTNAFNHHWNGNEVTVVKSRKAQHFQELSIVERDQLKIIDLENGFKDGMVRVRNLVTNAEGIIPLSHVQIRGRQNVRF